MISAFFICSFVLLESTDIYSCHSNLWIAEVNSSLCQPLSSSSSPSHASPERGRKDALTNQCRCPFLCCSMKTYFLLFVIFVSTISTLTICCSADLIINAFCRQFPKLNLWCKFKNSQYCCQLCVLDFLIFALAQRDVSSLLYCIFYLKCTCLSLTRTFRPCSSVFLLHSYWTNPQCIIYNQYQPPEPTQEAARP